MNSIKSILLNSEDEFNSLRRRVEKFHITFIILYFLPPVAAVILYSKYYHENFNLTVKIILYAIIVSGLFIHYFLRHRYHKSRKRYRSFIEKKLDDLRKTVNNDNDFKKIIVENAREIFKDKSLQFSNLAIKENQFWELIFINLGIEIDED